MQTFLDAWRRSMVAAACLSIALLGIGRVEFFSTDLRMSAWSVSRTTFFFWLVWKAFLWARYREPPFASGKTAIPMPLVLFFSLVTISLLPDFHDAGDYRYFFLAAMHYLMVRDLFCRPRSYRFVYLILALLPGLLFVRGILHDPSILELTAMRRFTHPFPHPNIAGYLFVMTIPLCLAVVVSESGKLRLCALVSCGAQLMALLLTYSRGSWLGWLTSMFFFGIIVKRKEAAALLIASGLVLAVTAPLRERVFSVMRPQTDLSINERMLAMEAGLKLGLEHPLLGVGYGRGRLREGLRELYAGPETEIHGIAHTHNLYIELFAETGFLGLGALLWLLWHALRQALANAGRTNGANRTLELGIAASWIGFAVTGFGDVPFFHHDVRILFFTLLALVDMPRENLASR